MGKTKTWEDEYTNMLKLKKSKQNFNNDNASFCSEKCRFQIDSSSPEKNLKIELSKEGSKNVDSVMNINISGNGDGNHKLIYNGGIENSSEYVEYTLTNMFVKLVSLHAINSDKYKMELVMQYVSSDDDVVYVCVLLNPVENNKIDEEGDVYEFFNEMANVLPNKVGKEVNVTKIKNWRISTLLPPKDDSGFRSFYTYNSAKTVNWIIFKTPLNIPVNFYDTFVEDLGIKDKNISNAMNIIPKTRKNITYVSDYDDSVMIKDYDGVDNSSSGGSNSKKSSSKKGSSKKPVKRIDAEDDDDNNKKSNKKDDKPFTFRDFRKYFTYILLLIFIGIISFYSYQNRDLINMYYKKNPTNFYIITGIIVVIIFLIFINEFSDDPEKVIYNMLGYVFFGIIIYFIYNTYSDNSNNNSNNNSKKMPKSSAPPISTN